MITLVPVATSDIKNFEKACKEAKVRFYKVSSDRIVTEYRVIHNESSTLFLLGWMTAKNKFEK